MQGRFLYSIQIGFYSCLGFLLWYLIWGERGFTFQTTTFDLAMLKALEKEKDPTDNISPPPEKSVNTVIPLLGSVATKPDPAPRTVPVQRQGQGQEHVLSRTEPTGNLLEIFPTGVKLVAYNTTLIEGNMSDSTAELTFHRFVMQRHVHCPRVVKLGIMNGMWPMCIDADYKPSKPCLIYSFGIGFDWGFDDAASRRFHCEVHGFDPSMNMGNHRRSQRIYFHAIGIGGQENTNIKGWKLKTLYNIRRYLGHVNITLDYLKMDVDFSEWESLEAIFRQNEILTNQTKQLALEIHTNRLHGEVPHVSILRQYQKTLLTLEELGFRKWYSHINSQGHTKRTPDGTLVSCCYEIVYINMRFAKEIIS